jgi:hypothetical protein
VVFRRSLIYYIYKLISLAQSLFGRTTGRAIGRLWVAKDGGGGGFFQGVVYADILETLNSFNIDVLGYIKGLLLNAMIICMRRWYAWW